MLKFTIFVTFGILLPATSAETGHFGTEYEKSIIADQTITISYNYSQNSNEPMTSPRLFVKLNDDCLNKTDNHYDLIIFVVHRGGSMTWQLPQTIDNGIKLHEMAHTLWTPINNTKEYINTSKIILNFSTSSKDAIKFTTTMINVPDFGISLQKEQIFNVTYGQPVIYYFKFEKVDMVLITVKSEDRTCMTLSIQNSSNGVFDSCNNVKYQGLRQTVSKNGGIIVSKNEYPFGLLLVFVVHSTNILCDDKMSSTHNGGLIYNIQERKTITLYIKPTANFNEQIMVFCIIVVLLAWLLMFVALVYRKRNVVRNSIKCKTSEKKSATSSFESNSGSSTVNLEKSIDNCKNLSLEQNNIENIELKEIHKEELPRKFKRIKTLLFVSDLATKDHNCTNSNSKLYLWNLIIVAIFYSLPVIQLVFSFQKAVNDYGNQDLCYYNFFCSYGLTIGNIKLSDFNHIFSNIGYVCLGLLFMIITYKREKANVPRENFGTPRHSGLYYAMGAALAMEGIMSACYHVCPNHSNFQFDTSFMYIICMLSIIKIYQTRHPDINANAYLVFGLLGFVIILGLSGILADNGLEFNIFFSVVHLTMCFWLSTYVYYLGYWKLDKKILKQYYEYLMSKPNSYIPKYKDRMILLSIGFLINFGLDVSHIVQPVLYGDFSNYLLILFMVNLILYLSYYIAMKLITKEHIYFGSYLCIVVAMIFWCAAFYFFIWRTSSWDVSAAQSRELNSKCIIFELFDSHDIWHFLSAFSLFFSFLALMKLDDDLDNKPTSTILIF